jgi:hypothetical protein
LPFSFCRTSAVASSLLLPAPRPKRLLLPQPRPATETRRPVLPSVVYCMRTHCWRRSFATSSAVIAERFAPKRAVA